MVGDTLLVLQGFTNSLQCPVTCPLTLNGEGISNIGIRPFIILADIFVYEFLLPILKIYKYQIKHTFIRIAFYLNRLGLNNYKYPSGRRMSYLLCLQSFPHTVGLINGAVLIVLLTYAGKIVEHVIHISLFLEFLLCSYVPGHGLNEQEIEVNTLATSSGHQGSAKSNLVTKPPRQFAKHFLP